MGKSINNLTRWHLARLFSGTGVEVGVERAMFSRTICRLNPDIKLFGVDPWKKGHNDRKDYDQETIDAFREIAVKRMAGFDWTPIAKFSVEAAKDFEDESLDFVYIDGAHDYKSVVQDINAWNLKVKKGGIISGHDYFERERFGVIKAVDEFVEDRRLDLIIWNGKLDSSWSFFK